MKRKQSINKDKVLVIMGPTASGKSALAIRLARDFDGEIISADSRQIYRQMDIGTGKIKRDDFDKINSFDFKCKNNGDVFISEGIIHHAIDIIDPLEDFNVTDFKKYAEFKIADILKRKKLPIICGGTGFWIKAIVDDIAFPAVKPNLKLRQDLDNQNTEELFIKLKNLDPQRAQTIDPKNKIRLIRAIEICQALGSVPKFSKNRPVKNKFYEFLEIGIKIEKNILQTKIKNRLKERFNQGMIKEVIDLNQNGMSWKKLESFGLEYRRIAEYLQQKISQKEMEEKLYFDIIHYAKRQLTWLKKNKNIIWLEEYEKIKIIIESYLKNITPTSAAQTDLNIKKD